MISWTSSEVLRKNGQNRLISHWRHAQINCSFQLVSFSSRKVHTTRNKLLNTVVMYWWECLWTHRLHFCTANIWHLKVWIYVNSLVHSIVHNFECASNIERARSTALCTFSAPLYLKCPKSAVFHSLCFRLRKLPESESYWDYIWVLEIITTTITTTKRNGDTLLLCTQVILLCILTLQTCLPNKLHGRVLVLKDFFVGRASVVLNRTVVNSDWRFWKFIYIGLTS